MNSIGCLRAVWANVFADETHGSKMSTRARPHQTVLIPDVVDHLKKLNMMSETFSGHHPYYSRNFLECQTDAAELESADEAECQICLESLPLVDFLTVAGKLSFFQHAIPLDIGYLLNYSTTFFAPIISGVSQRNLDVIVTSQLRLTYDSSS